MERLTVVEGSQGAIDGLINFNLPPEAANLLVVDPMVVARAKLFLYQNAERLLVKRYGVPVTTAKFTVAGEDI